MSAAKVAIRKSRSSKKPNDCGCETPSNLTNKIKALEHKNDVQYNDKCGATGCTNKAVSRIIVNDGNGHKSVAFVCRTHEHDENKINKNWKTWDITDNDKPHNLYQSFVEWLADKIALNQKNKSNIISSLKKMDNLHEIMRYMAELGLLSDNF